MEKKTVESFNSGTDTLFEEGMRHFVYCSLCSNPLNIIEDEIIIDENDFIICGWCFRNTRYA